MKHLYISGPITGMPDLNFPAFHEAARLLRAAGYTVTNPAELDAQDDGKTLTWEQYMRRDIKALMDCDGVALLPGWTESRGANLETEIAGRLGMKLWGVDGWLRKAQEQTRAARSAAERQERQMAALAVVGRITEVRAIDGADFIQAASVDCGAAGRWSGVVGKDVQAGDGVTVFLQDAILPPSDRWAFMEKHKWRVRMARFKGVPSECLIVKGAPDMPPGTDMAEALGVTKYEKPIPVGMQGDAIGAFPGHIPKTDEPNFQSVPELVERMRTEPWYATEKADGTSCTAYVDDAGLHVCSRNWELREFTASGASNVYWRAARKYGLDRLPQGVALQFEVVGPGVQGNPMGLAELEARAFTLRDTVNHRYLPWSTLVATTDALGMPTARFIGNGWQTDGRTDDELRKLAEIKYANGKQGEGIVIRALDSSWSFKVINLNYKD